MSTKTKPTLQAQQQARLGTNQIDLESVYITEPEAYTAIRTVVLEYLKALEEGSTSVHFFCEIEPGGGVRIDYFSAGEKRTWTIQVWGWRLSVPMPLSDKYLGESITTHFGVEQSDKIEDLGARSDQIKRKLFARIAEIKAVEADETYSLAGTLTEGSGAKGEEGPVAYLNLPRVLH